GRMGPLIRRLPMKPAQNPVGVFAPSGRDRSRGHGVFENKIPADDPGNEFAHGRVGISVGAARDGNHRGKLGVTETGKRAADPGDNERKNHRRTRAIRDGSSRPNKQTGADDPTDSERSEVYPAEGSF